MQFFLFYEFKINLVYNFHFACIIFNLFEIFILNFELVIHYGGLIFSSSIYSDFTIEMLKQRV